MYRNKNFFASLSAWLFGFVLFSGNAHAYLDPGIGSILLQGLIAAIVGVTVTARLYWSRIKSLLGMSNKDAEENSESKANDPPPD